MIRRTAALVLALLVTVPALPAEAQTRERVAFPSADRSFHGRLAAMLYRPPGSGPFPAMILLHNCYGVQPFLDGYAAWFAAAGYAAIIVESFGPRHAKDCNALPSLPVRALDAYGALAYLRGRPDIDPTRIGAIGWSHGGGGVFLADARKFSEDYSGGRPFRAVIAMYPVCIPDVQNLAAPLLVLQGAADDFTPPDQCLEAVSRLNGTAVSASMHVYPGVTHAFDNRTLAGMLRVDGVLHTIAYDAKAAQDARERILAFLAATLKP